MNYRRIATLLLFTTMVISACSGKETKELPNIVKDPIACLVSAVELSIWKTSNERLLEVISGFTKESMIPILEDNFSRDCLTTTEQ